MIYFIIFLNVYLLSTNTVRSIKQIFTEMAIDGCDPLSEESH